MSLTFIKFSLQPVRTGDHELRAGRSRQQLELCSHRGSRAVPGRQPRRQPQHQGAGAAATGLRGQTESFLQEIRKQRLWTRAGEAQVSLICFELYC